MAVIRYWDTGVPELNYWVPVGPLPDPTKYVKASGGAVSGPFPLVVDPGEAEPYAIHAVGGVTAARITTTTDGSLNTPIRLQSRTVDFGGSEVGNIGFSGRQDSLVPKSVVDGLKEQHDEFNPAPLGGSWVPSTIAGHAPPAARRNREGLVMLQGLAKAVTTITPGAGQWIMVLPEGWRPNARLIWSTFVTTYAYGRLDVHQDGGVHYIEGPVLTPGHLISLAGASFYTS